VNWDSANSNPGNEGALSPGRNDDSAVDKNEDIERSTNTVAV
jgi:hypothetical protein